MQLSRHLRHLVGMVRLREFGEEIAAWGISVEGRIAFHVLSTQQNGRMAPPKKSTARKVTLDSMASMTISCYLQSDSKRGKEPRILLCQAKGIIQDAIMDDADRGRYPAPSQPATSAVSQAKPITSSTAIASTSHVHECNSTSPEDPLTAAAPLPSSMVPRPCSPLSYNPRPIIGATTPLVSKPADGPSQSNVPDAPYGARSWWQRNCWLKMP